MADIQPIFGEPPQVGIAEGEKVNGVWNRLYKFIRSRVSTHEDAEDLLQDVFFKLLETYDASEPIERLSAWLFAVARNKVTDWYRRRRTEMRLEQIGEDSNTVADIDPTLQDQANDVERGLAREDFWRELTDALDALPPNQRDVFIKHEIEGMSFREIADESGEPMSALLSRKHYAVLKLRKRLASYRADSHNIRNRQ